jgi:hypothetical protein
MGLESALLRTRRHDVLECLSGPRDAKKPPSIYPPNKMKTKSPPESLPQDEPHQVKVIRPKKADRAILEAMAARYRVTNLTYSLEPF